MKSPEYEPGSIHTQHMSNAPEFGAHSGEDLWILSQFPEGYVGTALEAGALDGAYLSNTLLLERRGWDVLCVEPNPRFWPFLRFNRKRPFFMGLGNYIGQADVREDESVHKFTRSVVSATDESGKIPVITLDALLESEGVKKLDVLSLDTDGDEEDILSCFTPERWGTSVLVLEVDNGDEDPVHAWALSNGFELAALVGHNHCYNRRKS